MIRRDTDSSVFCPCIMPEKRARLVLSQSCCVFCSVDSWRLAILWLMLFLGAETSPCGSDVMERVRSPWVTALATSEVARAWTEGVLTRSITVEAQGEVSALKNNIN